jgi:hypothetical protein
MKIPLRILIGETLEIDETVTNWGDVIDTWETYAVLWNQSGGLSVDPTAAPVLDMFGDEGISIKSLVKDMSDPKKLFTDFSRSFTVPASKKNNRIFKHYYNIEITNGIDSRELVPARILMNNATYKVGNIRVEGAKMSKGVALSYKITFIGKLSELSRKIGQDRLSSLDLDKYNISSFNIKSQITDLTARDIMFPLSSRKERLVYNSGTKSLGIDNIRNIAYIDSTPADDYGIVAEGVVGAMSVGTLLDEIELKYGFNFTGAMTKDYVRDLRLWLHQTKNERSGDFLFDAVDDLTWRGGSVSGFTRNDHSLVHNESLGTPNTPGHIKYGLRMKGTWAGDAKLKMFRNGYIIATSSVSGQIKQVSAGNDGDVYTFTVESDTALSADIEISVYQYVYQLEEGQFGLEGYYLNAIFPLDATATVGLVDTFVVHEHMPKMKIMEFLSSLFKMFNLVAQVDNELNISTKHYDHFMSEGELKDITDYVDIESYDVNRPNIYSSLQMDFADPKVALELGYLAVNGKQYGELAYELTGNNGVRLSGSEYNLKLENQRIPVEPLTDLNDYSSTTVLHTLFSDLKGAEQQVKPSFTYIVKRLSGDSIAFSGETTVTSSTTYTTPSNSYNNQTLNNNIPNSELGILGLYFGEEISEYNPDSFKEGMGLWNSFYRGITAMMFNEDKRRVTFKSHLPQGVILNLSLADTFRINNKFYNINSIDTNYLTGVSKLDLTLVGRSRLPQFHTSWTITNNDSANILYITYIDINGELVRGQVAVSSTVTLSMIGDVIGHSHNDYISAKA